jgi:hypothetical protein
MKCYLEQSRTGCNSPPASQPCTGTPHQPKTYSPEAREKKIIKKTKHFLLRGNRSPPPHLTFFSLSALCAKDRGFAYISWRGRPQCSS